MNVGDLTLNHLGAKLRIENASSTAGVTVDATGYLAGLQGHRGDPMRDESSAMLYLVGSAYDRIRPMDPDRFSLLLTLDHPVTVLEDS